MSDLQIIWIAACLLPVFFMQAGFALLESGSTRAKNAVNVLMKNYFGMCVSSLVFWSVGFGLLFGENVNGWFGTNQFLPRQFSPAEAVRFAYQILFAAISVTIVSGAVAERIRFPAYLIFTAFATAIIYPVFGSWAWNPQGWLRSIGFMDFAGATVVHSIGAWCALAGIIVLGPRLGRYSKTGESREIPGHNLSSVALGGFILWMGWFGFNGGSIDNLESGQLGRVLINTHLSGSAAAVCALLFHFLQKKPVLLSSSINASLAGLVSITACAATVSPVSAVMIGAAGGVFYLIGAVIMEKLLLDDVVNAVSVHGIAGIWGTLSVALFSEQPFSTSVLLAQLTGVVAAFVWAFSLAFLFFKLLDLTMGIRVSTLHEQRGLDYSEHHELGYPEFQKRLDSEI